MLPHVAGQFLQILWHRFVGVRCRQGHAHLPQVAAFDQRKALPLGKPTTCAGSISGTLVLVTRSWVLEVNAVLPEGSELSVAPLTKEVV